MIGTKTLVLLALVAVCAVTSNAQITQGLERVGPVAAANGYPAWYQDKTGLTMEFCSPTNTAELEGGWCLLLPPLTVPEVFPTAFFDEHFYWAADALIDSGGVKARLVVALEGAFATGPVIPGNQIVFARVRADIRGLADGTYTIAHPFGTFQADSTGGRLFFTEDVGLACPPGQFDCALAGKIGPFLLPSATPGGAEMPPLSAANPTPDTDPAHFGGAFVPTPYPGTGKKYIADPARIGPVTGSPVGQNFFQVTGNNVSMQTSDFVLTGRIYEGPIGGQVTVKRASYARSATAQKVDVFATGFPSTQARIPAGAAPAVVNPQLQYYDAPCAVDPNTGAVSAPAGGSNQMFGVGTNYWGQSQPATIPAEVCVMQTNAVDANGNTFSAFFPTLVGDQVFVTEALYDPQAKSLSVKATSSDQVTPPILTAAGYGNLVNGSLVVSDVIAPPESVHVTSSAFGANNLQVTTGVGASGPGATVPTALNDAKTIAEDSGPTTIQVLANDTIGGQAIPAGSIVTLVAQARLGTAVVALDGTITYTPNPNANGPDTFTYSVAVNGVPSNVATVAMTITPVNDIPIAVNDNFNAFANVPTSLLVLTNDIDVDGPTDLVGVQNLTLVTSPAGSTVTLTPSGNAVSFTASTAGTYTFTYRAVDTAGAASANTATTTVIVTGGETINVTLAEYRRNSGRLRVTGTVSPVTNPPQRLELRWANGTNTVSVVATPVADATGAWAVDIRGAVGIQNPDNSGATRLVVTTPTGGRSPVTNIAFR